MLSICILSRNVNTVSFIQCIINTIVIFLKIQWSFFLLIIVGWSCIVLSGTCVSRDLFLLMFLSRYRLIFNEVVNAKIFQTMNVHDPWLFDTMTTTTPLFRFFSKCIHHINYQEYTLCYFFHKTSINWQVTQYYYVSFYIVIKSSSNFKALLRPFMRMSYSFSPFCVNRKFLKYYILECIQSYKFLFSNKLVKHIPFFHPIGFA